MISIVLVTYNRAERLRLSLQDILNQTFKNFELIICDDCSTDATETLCQEFAAKDKRIRYIRHASNKRMPANLNFGIQNANYPYVAILHDGDRFKPDLLAQWYKAITANESVGFVFNSVGVTDSADNVISTSFDYKDLKEGVVDKDFLLKGIYFRTPNFFSPVYGEAMVKKHLLEEKGYFKKKYGFYADVDFWMEVLHTHDAYFCADTLITGPQKEIQPRLFEDNPIRYFMYMFAMQMVHRKKAYRTKPIILVKELFIFWVQAFISLNFWLLIIVKNFSFRYFLALVKLLKGNFVFLMSWTIILVLYPLLYPFLKLYNTLKTLRPKPVTQMS